VDFERAEVRKRGANVNLSAKELQLLRYLVNHRGKIIPREELLRQVWEYSPEVSSRTVDVHIAWLRQKLEDRPQSPKYISTLRGRGYRFTS
jgi:two-component system, OmpR family, alkaline phosphatase synthesis response regulator PhoP